MMEIKLSKDELNKFLIDLWHGRGGPDIKLKITWVNTYKEQAEATVKLSRRNLKMLKKAGVLNHLKSRYGEKT